MQSAVHRATWSGRSAPSVDSVALPNAVVVCCASQRSCPFASRGATRIAIEHATALRVMSTFVTAGAIT
jgi:hypothetical protein